jgi:hypothetical protein
MEIFLIRLIETQAQDGLEREDGVAQLPWQFC